MTWILGYEMLIGYLKMDRSIGSTRRWISFRLRLLILYLESLAIQNSQSLYGFLQTSARCPSRFPIGRMLHMVFLIHSAACN